MQQNYRQRADLTFKHNSQNGRHGWLRLTPAYSVKIVHHLLKGEPPGLSVLDPFSGTATTALCAAEYGHNAVAVDINPFLVWFGKAKTSIYSPENIEAASDAGKAVVQAVASRAIEPVPVPPISNAERWWDAENLDYLCLTRAAIKKESEQRTPVRDLLDVAFCRCLIRLSNAAFNHQSMSFRDKKPDPPMPLWSTTTPQHDGEFLKDLDFVLQSACENPICPGRVILGDSRQVEEVCDGEYDLLITSPPYPNRMSYIRELRPYMYWLGYLKAAQQAGDMDWQAIGGTWGSATSRLAEWKPDARTVTPESIGEILAQIRAKGEKSGHLLSNYVGKYFEDMSAHIQSVGAVLKAGARVHYIVGNSSFYGVLVPTERLYADLMEKAGFRQITIDVIRKRNSKTALLEFDVSAVWSG